MNYSFKIINAKITAGFWQKPETEQPLFNKWTKLLGRNNNNLIVSDKKELCLVDANGNSVWENSITCSGIPNNCYVADDRLLVTTNSEDYHAWGFLGPAILIDLTKGRIIKELKGSHGLALSKGRFLLGLEGYDVFDTWLYDAEGNVVQQWKSCGHYIAGDHDSIRVVEQDRSKPTKAHVVRLNVDGGIDKGYKLRTSVASNPVSLSNGDIIFENSGQLVIIDSDLKAVCNLKLLDVSEENSWRFHSRISLNEKTLTVNILERLAESSEDYQTHEWVIELEEHSSTNP